MKSKGKILSLMLVLAIIISLVSFAAAVTAAGVNPPPPPNPSIEVSISAVPNPVDSGDAVDLTVSLDNTGNRALTNVYVELTGSAPLNAASSGFSGDISNLGVLDKTETWTWLVTSDPLVEETVFTAVGYGTFCPPGAAVDTLAVSCVPSCQDVTSQDEVTVEVNPVEPQDPDIICVPGEAADVTVIAINPETQITISTDATLVNGVYMVHNGDSVTLTVSEENTGDIWLDGVYVVLTYGTTTITLTTGYSGDISNTGILDPGEIWTWSVPITDLTATTTFYVVGHGFDPLGYDITACFAIN